MEIDYQKIHDKIIRVSANAALFIKTNLDKVKKEDIEVKELNSLVSYVDKEAEKIIVKGLSSLGLNACFITEEDTVQNQNSDTALCWVIDPLDGTTNYLRSIPHFSISISLEFHGEPVIGVVEDVMLNDVYSAIKDNGAFLNGNKIVASKVDLLSESMIATGFPYKKNISYESKLEVMKYCLENCRAIRRFGSAALDLVYVASGKFDVYYESMLNRWDLSAGALIAQEAGALVSDFEGTSKHLESGNILAANSKLYPEIFKVINEHLA